MVVDRNKTSFWFFLHFCNVSFIILTMLTLLSALNFRQYILKYIFLHFWFLTLQFLQFMMPLWTGKTLSNFWLATKQRWKLLIHFQLKFHLAWVCVVTMISFKQQTYHRVQMLKEDVTAKLLIRYHLETNMDFFIQMLLGLANRRSSWEKLFTKCSLVLPDSLSLP